jgi:hypothetical protein
MKRTSTFGMTLEQLRELFNVGTELPKRGSGSDEMSKRDLLEFRLAQNLPLDRKQLNQLPEVLSQLCQTMGQLTGDVVGEILQRPSSDLGTIRRLKKQAKYWAARAGSKDEHDTAAVIYYAAIAHALVFHDRQITQFSHQALVAQYSRLIAWRWMPEDLVVLFKLARAHCREKIAAG